MELKTYPRTFVGVDQSTKSYDALFNSSVISSFRSVATAELAFEFPKMKKAIEQATGIKTATDTNGKDEPDIIIIDLNPKRDELGRRKVVQLAKYMPGTDQIETDQDLKPGTADSIIAGAHEYSHWWLDRNGLVYMPLTTNQIEIDVSRAANEAFGLTFGRYYFTDYFMKIHSVESSNPELQRESTQDKYLKGMVGDFSKVVGEFAEEVNKAGEEGIDRVLEKYLGGNSTQFADSFVYDGFGDKSTRQV